MSLLTISVWQSGETEDSQGLPQNAQVALLAIHDIFPLPEVLQYEGGKNSKSEKKLQHEDAWWDPRKEILGSLLNGQAKTAQLPTMK